MTPQQLLIWLAGCFYFVREQGGNNRGPWVEAMQRVTGGRPGDAWCADFVSFVLAPFFGGRPPIRLTGGCDEMMADAVQQGLELEAPVAPCLFFRLNPADRDDAVHVGFVVEVHADGTISTIEGNTSPPPRPGDEGARDGGGVYRHAHMKPQGKRFFRIPIGEAS